jgi:predicted nucleotidyltransferase
MQAMRNFSSKAEQVINGIVTQLKTFAVIEKIILFGSRARNDADARSDIDLAILCPTASIREWLDICTVIEDYDTLLQIDVVKLDTASQQLQEKILQEGKVLYEKSN